MWCLQVYQSMWCLQGKQFVWCLQVDEPAVWTELGHAQLDNGAVGDAIASYLRRCASAVSGPHALVILPAMQSLCQAAAPQAWYIWSMHSSCAVPLQYGGLPHYLAWPHGLPA